MKGCVFLLFVVSVWTNIESYIVNPGPQYIPTQGSIWPKPASVSTSNYFYSINPKNFNFVVKEWNCAILEKALEDYKNIIVQQIPPINGTTSIIEDEYYLGEMTELYVDLNRTCEDGDYPPLNMDEEYVVGIQKDGYFNLTSESIWGILRGLESFSQLLYYSDQTILINCTIVWDRPRYSHRGFLLDTGRHFIPLDKIYQIILGMSYNKLNVFHWHIVDDQSFPFVSSKFPELSSFGAYHPSLTYSPEDVANVIEFARLRGIRVIPEFDTPGHTRSWGQSHPELLTSCDSVQTGAYGPIDPSKNTTYNFLEKFFEEIRDVFKDQFIHLGGDEVDYDCWELDRNISDFMSENNITSYAKLEGYFIGKLLNITDRLNFSSIVWEEVFNNGVDLPQETIVHIWRDWTGALWRDTMQEVTKAGKTALLSACWYLDHLSSGGDWVSFYRCEPTDFTGTDEQKALILGGEACMWAEVVDKTNVVQRVFPRASATAEKLWSPKEDNFDSDLTARRLEEHTCRMNRRNIPAQPPNGPGYCISSF
ncbi:hypothetical protein ABEB36_006412 [Hypothenemus hampei]|uniref:Beta-hexosaminidase n=1 Tax=Hypothenemus hampei TaxID=57062 RepID=A0ABD1EUC8_HYPHA